MHESRLGPGPQLNVTSLDGWIDGRNLNQYAKGKKEHPPDLVNDLIRQTVEIIVITVTVDTLTAKNATAKIPIVMVAVANPVAIGIVKSLARPSGNVTGLSHMTPDLNGKPLNESC
jgi:putative tryptophan/tyrosine transport system substrate-binding protein